MGKYLLPIKEAVTVFPFVVIVVLIPFMIYQYRKYGSVSTTRSFLLYAFVFYLMSAYFLVILPLPDRESVTTTYTEMMQWVPFQFVTDFLDKTVLVLNQPSTYLKALTQGVTVQPLFNILLTIPFGMYLRYYFKRNFVETVFASFLLSLFFELTQLSGLYGYYPGPYRLFDVDDLILNTLGGGIGYGLGPLLETFFPSRERIDKESYQTGSPVTYTRRVIAYLVDLVFLTILSMIFEIGLNIVGIHVEMWLLNLMMFMLYFMVLPMLTGRSTLGQRILKIKIVADKGSLTWWKLGVRVLLFYVFFSQAGVILNALFDMLGGASDSEPVVIIIYFAIFMGWYLFLAIHVIYTSIKHHWVLFYERLSGTHMITTFVAPKTKRK